MTTRRLFLAKLAALAGFTLLSKAKGDYTKPLSLPVVVPPIPYPKDRQPVRWGRQTIIDYDRLLYCISEIETGHYDAAVGRCGSRSRYQISELVWEQHMARTRFLCSDGQRVRLANFHRDCREGLARLVAVEHVRWLRGQLGPETSVQSLAWCWKEGLLAYQQQHSNRASVCSISSASYARGAAYASRVSNLYNDPTYQHT